MSIFGKLLGRRGPDEERKRGDELFERGEFGLAKLAYDRARDLLRDQPEEARAELARKADACRDALARARLAEAETLLRGGARDLALGELHNAVDTAASPELIAEAERLIESLERSEARAQAAAPEQSDEDRFETIAGSFEPEQYDEYEGHGPELRAALLALYDGQAAQARPALERMVASAERPHYLWFELGRARLLDGDASGGREALHRFIELCGPSGGGESRLVAHMELAGLHDETSDFEAAAAEYEAALEAMPDDPRPYLAMALFFRRAKLPAEAIEVLNSGLEVLQEQHRQWRFTLELGLAHADLGEEERAVELLEEVIDHFTARHQLDLPPECAVRLAELHDKRGNKPRALDLYRLLANGSDLENRFAYHLKTAELMAETGHASDARRTLIRALELAPDQSEVRAELERRLAELR